jgi:pimeloyl-ACP methyl ester carboxylesterase
MLHGGAGRSQLYSGMLAELAERCHVYAPDLRGHGTSGWVPWGYTFRDYVEDMGTFLREVSGPAVLMGHSLGGIIAVAAAKACPDLVRALIVGDAPLDAASWGSFSGTRVVSWRRGAHFPVARFRSKKLKDYLGTPRKEAQPCAKSLARVLRSSTSWPSACTSTTRICWAC